MYSLAEGQKGFAATLQEGPSAYPAELFEGPIDRIMLGLKSHANTISHARLVALEQTFPHLREHMGHEAFHGASRHFIDLPATMECTLTQIGTGFAEFIASQGADEAGVDLANFEWAWLQSYHSAEAVPLNMGDIAALDEEGLVSLSIARHPSLHSVSPNAALSPILAGLFESETPGSTSGKHILIVRPEADVLISLQEPETIGLIDQIEKSAIMGNLLQFAIETYGEEASLAKVFALVQAGMIIRK